MSLEDATICLRIPPLSTPACGGVRGGCARRFNDDQVDFDARLSGPAHEAAGECNAPALRHDDLQPAFARVPLPDGVGGDHPQSTAGTQQRERPPEECRTEVGCAAEWRQRRFQPAPVRFARDAADAQSPHERRVAEDDIEPAGRCRVREL